MSKEMLVPASEFNLEETKALQIESAFTPKIAEREAYVEQYNEIITSEITPELVIKANELRKRLVKIRTSISDIHKVEKAYYLAAGRYVDAIKNKITLPVEQMEEKLEEIQNYFVNQEKERLAKLQSEREALLVPFGVENVNLMKLAEMDSEVWEAYFSKKETDYKAIKEAEAKAESERLEQIRLDDLERTRKYEIAPYIQFFNAETNLRDLSENEYKELLESLVNAKKEYLEEQEKIKLENERLKAEAEKAAKQAELERENARKEAEKLEAKRQAELAEERAKQVKLQAELEAKERAEREAKQREEQAELEAKKEAERLAKAPIKKQMEAWVNSFQLPNTDLSNDSVNEIKAKFESFKNWSLKELDKF